MGQDHKDIYKLINHLIIDPEMHREPMQLFQNRCAEMSGVTLTNAVHRDRWPFDVESSDSGGRINQNRCNLSVVGHIGAFKAEA